MDASINIFRITTSHANIIVINGHVHISIRTRMYIMIPIIWIVSTLVLLHSFSLLENTLVFFYLKRLTVLWLAKCKCLKDWYDLKMDQGYKWMDLVVCWLIEGYSSGYPFVGCYREIRQNLI